MTYELTDDGLVTSDPQIAVIFLGEGVEANCGGPIFVGPLESISWDNQEPFCVDTDVVTEITISRPLVLKAIEPDGKETFLISSEYIDIEAPTYYTIYGDDFSEVPDRYYTLVKANALTIGATSGELRTLLDWAKE